MSNKKATVLFISGLLAGLFIIPPILSYFGIPSFSDFLAKVFGEDNTIVLFILLIVFLAICLLAFGAYKKAHKQELDE